MILQIVADDLGYNDLGFTNGEKTFTPHINEAVKNGIQLTSYHTYKVCSPTRSSLMTGRYPWGIGYYDMKGPEMVPLSFVMLPQLLHDMGWATHALGKWNLGNLVKDFTPTYRGFQTFTGYYAAALVDYWYHGSPEGRRDCNSSCASPGTSPSCLSPTDLSNSSGQTVGPADASWINGTYDELVFTREAVRLISGAASDKGFYMYLAYQNVHSTAQSAANGVMGTHPIQAPCSVVDVYCDRIAEDTYKAHGGALAMLDFGVGNVTAALNALSRPYLIAFVADNGGPLPHSTNAPFRGGKHTLWDGGVRVVSWVSGPLVPPPRRGSKWGGLAHSSDWYVTFVEGVAGGQLPAHTGPRAVDGHNLWPALLTGGTSPRTEVVHQVVNNYTIAGGLEEPAVIRIGKYKLIAPSKEGAGDFRIVPWPTPTPAPVPFGTLGNGSRNGLPEDTDACRAPVLNPGPTPPPGGTTCAEGCLFDVEKDISESKNLYHDSSLAAVVKSMTAR